MYNVQMEILEQILNCDDIDKVSNSRLSSLLATVTKSTKTIGIPWDEFIEQLGENRTKVKESCLYDVLGVSKPKNYNYILLQIWPQRKRRKLNEGNILHVSIVAAMTTK